MAFKQNILLLFDYVHLIKCVRNNWLSEKCGEILYEDEAGQQQTAKWSHLKHLLTAEKQSMMKLSKLNYVSVYPKPVERQNVKFCLNVFCDETVVAL